MTMFRNNRFFSSDPKVQYFECLRCGDCCKTSDIPISAFDIYRLARYRKKKPDDVITKFCRLGFHPCPKNEIVKDDMLGIVFIFKDKPCTFFLNQPIPTCTLYDVRPIVCENTPNPCNPWSIYHMYSTCQGLQASRVFPEDQRDYYRQICNLHARMLSLTARFFRDALGMGQPLSELSAKFGETPDTIVTPTGEKNTYEVIELLDNTMFKRLQKHYNVMQETIEAFNAGHDIFMYNFQEILSKTLTSVPLRERFLTQVGLKNRSKISSKTHRRFPGRT